MRIHWLVPLALIALITGTSRSAGAARASLAVVDSTSITIPPTVGITCPQPTVLAVINTLPSLRIQWDGTD